MALRAAFGSRTSGIVGRRGPEGGPDRGDGSGAGVVGLPVPARALGGRAQVGQVGGTQIGEHGLEIAGDSEARNRPGNRAIDDAKARSAAKESQTGERAQRERPRPLPAPPRQSSHRSPYPASVRTLPAISCGRRTSTSLDLFPPPYPAPAAGRFGQAASAGASPLTNPPPTTASATPQLGGAYPK